MRFLLPLSLALATFVVSGCSTPEKRLAKLEQQIVKENTRATEERRMRAMTYGEVDSQRGAEILVVDPNKSFDPSRSGIGTVRPYGTGGAPSKGFLFKQKAPTNQFATREYAGAKANGSGRTFATSSARTSSADMANLTNKAGQKTADTRDAIDSTKMASTRGMQDAKRPFLGAESRKLGTSLDPKTLADWRNSGNESVIYGPSSIERAGTLKQLTIDDVRELLNKSK